MKEMRKQTRREKERMGRVEIARENLCDEKRKQAFKSLKYHQNCLLNPKWTISRIKMIATDEKVYARKQTGEKESERKEPEMELQLSELSAMHK